MMMPKIRIAASILAANFARLGEQVRAAEQSGVDMIHVDVMDGHYVPNISVGPLVVRALRPVTDLPIYVHLMIQQPERYIEDFVSAGADSITVHVETCPHLHRTLQQIKEQHVLAGVTLNPATSLCAIEEVLSMVDLVLVMAVNPGFGGQRLIPATLDKISRLRKRLDTVGLESCPIEVDGGVNETTLEAVLSSGAEILVMGTAIFGDAAGPAAAVERLRAAIAKHSGQPV